MNYFPTIVVDRFLEDPDYALGLAKSVEYDELSETDYPGVVSKKTLKNIDKNLCDYVIEKVVGYYWDTINPVEYDMQIEFQRIDPKEKGILNKGIIHIDSAFAGGVIYLNNSPSRNSGTSFYEYLDPYEKESEYISFLESIKQYHSGKDVDELEKICKMHYNRFTETMRVQSQYNRLCMYSGDVFHAPTTYGNQPRYTIRFFIDQITSEYQNYPLLR